MAVACLHEDATFVPAPNLCCLPAASPMVASFASLVMSQSAVSGASDTRGNAKSVQSFCNTDALLPCFVVHVPRCTM